MRQIWIAGAAALLIAPVAAAAAPFQFDCRGGLGQGSEVWIAQAGPNYRVRGRLEVDELVDWPYPPGPLRIVGNHVPPTSRGVHITVGSRSESTYVSLSVALPIEVDDRLDVIAGFENDGVRSEPTVMMTLPFQRHPAVSLPFEIVADASGVSIEVRGQRVRFDVPIGRDGEIRLSCAGGQFIFWALDWDAASDAEPGEPSG